MSRVYWRFSRRRFRGTVLVLALVVSVLLALAVFTFTNLMLSERRGAVYGSRQKQVRLLAESGVEWLRLFLSQDQLTIEELGDLYDNPDFCGYLITDGTLYTNSRRNANLDPREVGRFTILAPCLSDDGSLIGESCRYGVEDESGKINLHWVMQVEAEYPGMGRIILTRLPGVDETIADSILDWMDEDDEAREYGAEYDYYEALDPPYAPKNAVPDSIDELLLVAGITPQLLYGIDWNRNGILDIGEPDTSTLEEVFEVYDESLNLGLAAYITVDSRESLLTPDGTALKINVNSEDMESLREQLLEVLENEEWVEYIVAYRQYGPASGSATTSDISSEQQEGDESSQSGGGNSQSGSGNQQGSSGGSQQGSGSSQGSSGGSQQGGGSSQGSGSSSSGGGSISLGGSEDGSVSLDGSDSSSQQSSQQEMTKIKTLLEFVGGSAKTSSDESGGTLESPFSSDIDQMREYLPILYDNLTIVSEPMVGRINLNQAPRAVLEMFSTQFDDSDAAMEAIYNAYGIDPSTLELASSVSSLADSASGSSDGSSSEGDSSESDSESGASSGELPVAGSLLEMLGIPADEVEPLIKGILEIRIADPIEAAESEPDMLYPYWPYTLGVTENLDVIKKLEPYFCTRGSVYRAQVVGRFDAKSPAVRFEVWFDATIRPAKIIRIRELSELGPGYPPYTLGIDDTEYQ